MKGKEGKIAKRILSIALMFILIVLPVFTVNATGKVTPSSKEYEVDLNAATPVFLGNEKAVKFSEGEAVFLTYTVESAEFGGSADYTQHGVVASQNREEIFPYDKIGLMEFGWEASLLKEGYTYFLKFEVTEFGFECIAVYTNGQEEDYMTFPNQVGTVMEDMKYAGIWFSGKNVTGKLTHVHCYDKDGKDLGVATNNVKIKNGATVYDPAKMKTNSKIKYTYEFELTDASNVAISNERATKADVVYMEYTVKNAKNTMSQTGVEMTNSPTSVHPHAGDGALLQYEQILDGSGSVLAISGATYLVRFERTKDGFDALVRYTLNGQTKYATFSQRFGMYNKGYKYCSLWFGDGENSKLSAQFVDFKCYDEEGNNLAVQTNQGVEVIRHGGLEDYSACEAVYYCIANDTFISLDDDQKITKRVDGAETAVSGTYLVDGMTLTMKAEGEETKYTYYYKYMLDADNNKYVRLKESKVRFVTGQGEETKTTSAKESFKVKKPEDPTSENGTFKAWCKGDGSEFDFEQVVMGNTTLYAKWVDGDGNEYLATATENVERTITDIPPSLAIGTSVVLVLLTVIGIVYVVKRGKKHEEK